MKADLLLRSYPMTLKLKSRILRDKEYPCGLQIYVLVLHVVGFGKNL